jgi:chromosome segregation ATPase
MLALGYRVAGEDAAEALWPVELYHGDPRARRLARVREQLDRASVGLEERSAQLAEARQALTAAGAREQALLQELEQAKAQAAAVQDEQGRAEESYRQQIASLNARLEQATRELADARAVTAQSVKLLNLREADLSELRNRYGALQAELLSRRELLSELGRRLGQTHEHFAQLVAGLDGKDR